MDQMITKVFPLSFSPICKWSTESICHDVELLTHSIAISHLALNSVLLGVKSDPVMLGEDTHSMSAWVQSFIAGEFPVVGMETC